jgi:cellobiose-specific phosphotransferase system component IIA
VDGELLKFLELVIGKDGETFVVQSEKALESAEKAIGKAEEALQIMRSGVHKGREAMAHLKKARSEFVKGHKESGNLIAAGMQTASKLKGFFKMFAPPGS